MPLKEIRLKHIKLFLETPKYGFQVAKKTKTILAIVGKDPNEKGLTYNFRSCSDCTER